MLKPFAIEGSIAASATKRMPGNIQLVRCRTLTVWLRCKCGASLDANPKLIIYTSPDGKNVETETNKSFTVTYSAGNYVMRGENFDPPEHGYAYVDVQNQSSADALSDVSVWYSIQAWSPDDKIESGDIRNR